MSTYNIVCSDELTNYLSIFQSSSYIPLISPHYLPKMKCKSRYWMLYFITCIIVPVLMIISHVCRPEISSLIEDFIRISFNPRLMYIAIKNLSQ